MGEKCRRATGGERKRRAAEALSERAPLLKECSPAFSFIKMLCTLFTSEIYPLLSEHNLFVRF